MKSHCKKSIFEFGHCYERMHAVWVVTMFGFLWREKKGTARYNVNIQNVIKRVQVGSEQLWRERGSRGCSIICGI